MSCMLVSAASAILGYAGRIMMYHNPFNFSAFMLQISEQTTLSRMLFHHLTHVLPLSLRQYKSRLLLRCDIHYPCPHVSPVLHTVFQM